MLPPISPGFFLVRLVRKGPRVPAQVLFDGMLFRVEINGKQAPDAWRPDELDALWGDTAMQGEAFSHPLLRIALFGERISELEYRYRCLLRDWAERNDPGHSAARPGAPVDLTKQRSIF